MRPNSTSRTASFMGFINTFATVLYLYNTPGTSYSQLMVADHKAESEGEEISDKVRARAMVVTDLGAGTVDWGNRFPSSWPP